MKLKIENNPVVKSFISDTTSENGNKYIIKLLSYEHPISETEAHGPIRSGAFIEAPNGEIIGRMFFPEIFDDEDLLKQGEYMVKNIDKILKDENICINQSL